MLANTKKSYGLIARLFHWSIAILILALIPVGWYMAEYEVYDIYPYHKAAGMLVLFLGILRLMWTLTNVHPDFPEQMSGMAKTAAYIGHSVLYVLILLMPISGYVSSSTGGYDISFFGLFDIPLLIAKNESLHEMAGEAHEIISFTALAIIIGHVIVAYKHHFIDKDNTIQKMTTGVK
ncbi:cytochrome b [Candidatus Albibeggiatoa sp. nov. NOAA]|uniref:cytochrome b n=1 Tax=Candidatus Albibeggiatoa sp. nov. NOAA TaxID=3162724 RepID=UPI0032FDFDC8|nr:cytochrome b [Thiotrichaceae bacterium]